MSDVKLLKSGIYRIVNFEDDTHCIPNDDWFEHPSDVNCPCAPYLDRENLLDIKIGRASRHVWVHNQIKYNKESQN